MLICGCWCLETENKIAWFACDQAAVVGIGYCEAGGISLTIMPTIPGAKAWSVLPDTADALGMWERVFAAHSIS